ncbi:unnamed protein product [Callosobruchus maculatus]|uniref:Mitochondrial ribonuclease P catalytic subunit n=1 Tax=Callosobruchus maculatus TaxID=64391 RepID=A0A653BI06_CALMS|nr:unnamed protein product [Callosobruchus maculatus]
MLGKCIYSTISKKCVSLSFIQQRGLIRPRKTREYFDVVRAVMDNSTVKSLNDWKNVRNSILEHSYNSGKYTKNNIDALIINYCANKKDCDLGTSYLNFLKKENIEPNLATIGKYLKLLYTINADMVFKEGKKLPVIEEELILRYYEDLRRDYPVLDSYSLENAILALSVTSKWRTCLDLLKDIEATATPNNLCYSSSIAAAFINKEEELGWAMLEEMLQCERIPNSYAFHGYLSRLRRHRSKRLIIEKLEMLFLFLQKYDMKCPEDVIKNIADLADGLKLLNIFTTVSFKGICQNCQSRMTNFELTPNEFAELKGAVLENVIVGKNVFSKTDPDELERFKKFVTNMGTFDVVLDGLNVAYSAGTKNSPVVHSGLVAAVVSHFVENRRRVLVLGRKHMNKWPKQNWGYVNENATVFLTQNISQDDPYLLYCALQSGQNTVIVTRDLMRSHRFLLESPNLKKNFNRWLNQRQWQLVRVDEQRGPIFRKPPPFTVTTQKANGLWHIPYEQNKVNEKDQYIDTWLCLKTTQFT